jgi:hypothetical protein
MIKPAALPFVCALFTWSVGSLLGQYGALFYAWPFPSWLFFLLLAFALESVYFSTYVLSPRTPLTWRLLEIGLMIALVLVCARHGQNFDYPWWALTKAALDRRFIFPFGLTFFVWTTAGGYGSQLANMARLADHLGDQAASTISWEHDSLELKPANSSLPIEYFLRRFTGFGLILVSLAVAAQRTGHTAELGLGELVMFGSLYTTALGSGLFLQGSAYLYRLHTIWQQIGMQYPAQLAAGWMRNLLVVSLVLVLIVNVMPVDFSPLTFDDLAGFVLRLFADTSLEMPSLERSETIPQTDGGALPMPWMQAEGEPSFWAGLFALIYMIFFGGTVALALVFAIGYLVATFAKSELEKLRGLPRLAVRFYLVLSEVFKGAWVSLYRGLRRARSHMTLHHAVRSVSDELSLELRSNAAEDIDPLAQDIRGAYRQILKRSKEVGIPLLPGDTPGEFGSRLTQEFPQETGEIQGFIESYHLARYSKTKLDHNLTARALARAQRIGRALRQTVRGKSSDKL